MADRGGETGMQQDWLCAKCGYQGLVKYAPDEGVHEVRNRIEDAHARCSGSCAKEHGLFFVTVTVPHA